MSETRYELAPGLEIVPVGEDRFLLRSDFKALNLSGETAAEVIRRVLSVLDRPLTLPEILTRMPEYRPESVRAQVETLVGEGVLVEAKAGRPARQAPFTVLFEQLGLGAEEVAERLAALKVGVFGLEAHGAYLARMLADLGVGTLLLADPFPFEEAHLSLTPVLDLAAVGRSRQDALAAALGRRSGLRVETAGDGSLDKERTLALSAGCSLLVACWDRGFAAAHHWLNQAAQEHGVPVLFSELRTTVGFAGPFHLPGRSACWMCSRMRALACEEDFELAMAHEEHLDRKLKPELARRGVLPVLPIHLATTLGLDAVRYLTRLGPPVLVDRILEVDGLRSESRYHPVLVQPDCPACGKKNSVRTPALGSF